VSELPHVVDWENSDRKSAIPQPKVAVDLRAFFKVINAPTGEVSLAQEKLCGTATPCTMYDTT